MNIEEFRREEYDHERQTGQHAEGGEEFEILFKRYTLRVVWRAWREEDEDELEETVERALREAEENISDLLPEGYYCKIEEA